MADPKQLSVPQLKAILREDSHTTTGGKTELVNRLMTVDPESSWAHPHAELLSNMQKTDIGSVIGGNGADGIESNEVRNHNAHETDERQDGDNGENRATSIQTTESTHGAAGSTQASQACNPHLNGNDQASHVEVSGEASGTSGAQGSRELEWRQREIVTSAKERELLEREVDLLRRELTVARMMNGNVSETNSSRSESVVSRDNVNRINLPAIADMLGPFEEKTEGCDSWVKRLVFLKESFNLDDAAGKALVSMQLKGKAADWLYSKPEFIRGTFDDLVSEIKSMYLNKKSKLSMLRTFEYRVWKPSETFREYAHDKIILANELSLDQSETI